MDRNEYWWMSPEGDFNEVTEYSLDKPPTDKQIKTIKDLAIEYGCTEILDDPKHKLLTDFLEESLLIKENISKPKTLYVGLVLPDDNFKVIGYDAHLTHGDYGELTHNEIARKHPELYSKDKIAWRYRSDLNIVYWWGGIPGLDVRDAVNHWINENTGNKNPKNKILHILHTDTKYFRDAHGKDIQESMYPKEFDRHSLGSCMSAIQMSTEYFLKKGIKDFKIVEGWVAFGDEGDEWELYRYEGGIKEYGNVFTHTWIQFPNGRIFDPTKKQWEKWGFNPEEGKIVKVKTDYLPEEYLDLCEWDPSPWTNFKKKIDESIEHIGSEDLEDGDYEQLNSLIKNSGINILSNKELTDVIKLDNIVIAGLWTSWNNDTFSFDIIVHPNVQRQGYARELTKVALQLFNQDKEAYENPKLEVDAVNPASVDLLKKYFGFEELSREGNHVIMGRPQDQLNELDFGSLSGRRWKAFWMEPNGKLHELYSTENPKVGHWNWAKKYCEEHDIKYDNPNSKLGERGWVRITFNYHNDNSLYFYYWTPSIYNEKLMSEIKNLAIELKATKLIDERNDTEVSLLENHNTTTFGSMIAEESLLKMEENMTYDDLLKLTTDDRKERAKNVNVRSLPVSMDEDMESWNFRYKSSPATTVTDKPFRGKITFLKGEVSSDDDAQKLECKVDCSCQDYTYRWAYNNYEKNAGNIGNDSLNKCINRSPKPAYDAGVGLCKHLVSLGNYLKTKISSTKKNNLFESVNEVFKQGPFNINYYDTKQE